MVRIGELRTAIQDLRGTLLTVGAIVIAALIAVVVLVALRSSAPRADVHVEEQEYRIHMPATLGAGDHQFEVRDDGSVPHEFLLFRTPLAPGALPTLSHVTVTGTPHLPGDVDESSPLLHRVARITRIQPGQHALLAVHLAPGHYVAVCNVPGHYRFGMRAGLTVR